MNKSEMKRKILAFGFSPDIFIENSDTNKNQIRLTCEINSGYLAAGDYYDGPFYGWPNGINPNLKKLADKYDLYWEWENPSVISLYLD